MLQRHVDPSGRGRFSLVDWSTADLVLEHAASCDGEAPRGELTRYDPTTRRERAIVRLRSDEAFGRILVFGEERASAY